MAKSLFCKEKVALSFLLCITLCYSSAQAQSKTSRITYSCRSERLEVVIDNLSKRSGFDFIYSRNLVDVSKQVSLSAQDLTITQVLSLLEKQLDVSFKLQDRHIIVKANPKPAPVIVQQTKRESAENMSAPPSYRSTDPQLITSLRRNIAIRQPQSQAALLQNSLQKRIDELQALLGPNVPRTISRYDISQINFNNRHRGWFAAIGTSVGDGSAGVELQAGLPFAYAVFRPRYSAEHGLFGAYGVGTGINLSGNYSMNAIYMFSGVTSTTSAFPYSGPYSQQGPELRHTENQRHHQVKLVLQYNFANNFSLRVGPVLNYRNTREQTVIIPTSNYYEGSYASIQYASRTPENFTLIYKNGQLVAASRIERHLESWVGWDATVTYRINFFRRR